jgi:hypothetical protein
MIRQVYVLKLNNCAYYPFSKHQSTPISQRNQAFSENNIIANVDSHPTSGEMPHWNSPYQLKHSLSQPSSKP